MDLLPIAVLVLRRVLLLLLLSVAIVFSRQARKHHLVPPPSPHDFPPPDYLSSASHLVFRSPDDGAGPGHHPAWEPGEEPRAVKSGERGDMACVVCMSEMGEAEEVRELRCGHVFHRACVDDWVGGHGHGTCPLCRSKLGRSTHL